MITLRPLMQPDPLKIPGRGNRFYILGGKGTDRVFYRVFFSRFLENLEQLNFAADAREIDAEACCLIVLDETAASTPDPEFLSSLKRQFPGIPFIVMLRPKDSGVARKFIRNGAEDVLFKSSCSDAQFRRSIEFALERNAARRNLCILCDPEFELFETSPHPSYVFELDTLRIIRANRRFREIYGYSPGEILFMSVFDLRVGEDRDRIEADMTKLRESGTLQLSAISHRIKNGDILTVDKSSRRLNDSSPNLAISTIIDVTEKVMAEKSLLRMNEIFQHANRAKREVIYDWNLKSNELLWSESLNEQFGFETNPGDFTFARWAHCVHELDRPCFINMVEQVISGENSEGTIRQEYRLKRLDGSYAFVKDQALVLRSEDGSPFRIIGAIEDISESREAELQIQSAFQELQRNTYQYENLFAEAPAFICYLRGPEYIFEFANPEHQRLIGDRETIGLPVEQALPELREQGFLDRIDFVFQNGKSISGKECPVYFKNPQSGETTTRFINYAFLPNKNAEGQVEGVYLFGVDVTDHVLNRQQIEKSDEERRDILNSITDVFFALDSNFLVTFWNSAAATTFSLKEEEVLDRSIQEIFTHPSHRSLLEAIKGIMQRKETRFFELHDQKLGLWFEGSIYPKADGLSVFLKNISKEKILELKMRKVHVNLTALINSTDDLIWSVDKEGILISANEPFIQRVQQLTGFEVREGSPVDLPEFGEDLLSEWRTHYDRAFRGERFTIQTRTEHSGEISYSTFNFNPIYDDHGNVTGVACFSRDVTEKTNHLKAIEEQNRQLKEIAWMQSHVARAPLARIMGLIDLIKHNDQGEKSMPELIGHLDYAGRELDKAITEIANKSATINIL